MSAVSSMSTMAAGKLADYHAAVAQFQAASLGAYAGPSTPFDFLQQKIGAIDGLNPQELVTGTAAAVGPTAVESRGRKSNSMERGIGGFFRGVAIDALGSFGGGALLNFFDKLATDDADDDLQCRGLMKDSQQCAETIEDICTTSDTAMSEMLEPATHVISILTQFIRRTPLGALASSAVSVASDLIENTNEQIIGACQDRDESVEKCFEEFLRRCGDISVRPLPCEPPDTADCPLPTHPAGEHTCEPPPQDIQSCPEETIPSQSIPSRLRLPRRSLRPRLLNLQTRKQTMIAKNLRCLQNLTAKRNRPSQRNRRCHSLHHHQSHRSHVNHRRAAVEFSGLWE